MSLETLKTRINYMGGNSLGRIKMQKLRSFKAALLEDYNSRRILTPLGEEFQALINDNNTKSDYDKRYISVVHEAQLEPGDVFECLDDNTHWMIYLQDLVEIAYLKSEIIRCRYQLDVDGELYWIYFQGPTETALRWNFKRGLNWNDLNFSGTIYIKKTEQTKDFFNRFTKLKIDGHTWQVKVRDTLTVPGIIELEVQEYFDSVTEGVAEVVKVDSLTEIIGKHEVENNSSAGYQIDANMMNSSDTWFISGNDNVVIKELQLGGQICVVDILPDAIGNFVIHYGDFALEVAIQESLTNADIIGPTEVYPYDSYLYEALDQSGIYSVSDITKAHIINQKDGVCYLEITASKKGSFVLTYSTDKTSYSLPIKILSL